MSQPLTDISPMPETPNNEIMGMLIQLEKVTAAQQTRLLGRLRKIGIADSEVNTANVDFDATADMIEWFTKTFALDGRFEAATSGPGGFETALDCIVTYAGELGKGKN